MYRKEIVCILHTFRWFLMQNFEPLLAEQTRSQRRILFEKSFSSNTVKSIQNKLKTNFRWNIRKKKIVCLPPQFWWIYSETKREIDPRRIYQELKLKKNTFFFQTSLVRKAKRQLKLEKQRKWIELTVLHGRRDRKHAKKNQIDRQRTTRKMSDKTAIFIENFEKFKEKTSHYDTNEIASNLCIVRTKFNDTKKLQENRRFAKRFILNSLDRNTNTHIALLHGKSVFFVIFLKKMCSVAVHCSLTSHPTVSCTSHSIYIIGMLFLAHIQIIFSLTCKCTAVELFRCDVTCIAWAVSIVIVLFINVIFHWIEHRERVIGFFANISKWITIFVKIPLWIAWLLVWKF